MKISLHAFGYQVGYIGIIEKGDYEGCEATIKHFDAHTHEVTLEIDTGGDKPTKLVVDAIHLSSLLS